MKMDIHKIVEITGGRLLPGGTKNVVATGISTDSRSLVQGDLFVPLRGHNYDGHDYLLQAVRRGAALCLSEEVIAGLPVPVVQVSDTLKALGDLAAEIRNGYSGPVVAVTGSSGKTTTKEMLASILSRVGNGLKTQGNFNNFIGLPQTLFGLEPTHKWALLEMGMSARGEIARLAEIARPDIGVITNVGPAHLESLHGLDGVARAKGELFAALPPGGTAVINADDERVQSIPVANGVRRLLFGIDPGAEIRAEGIEVTSGAVHFRLLTPSGAGMVRLQVNGRYNVSNALAAAAAAFSMNIDVQAIVAGLEAFVPARGRMETLLLPGGVTLLEDTYNANPLSVAAALRTLDEMGGDGRRLAVLGDMLELGENAGSFHREIGAEAASRADFLLLMGEMTAFTAEGARQAGMPAGNILELSSHQEVADRLCELLCPGDRVLIKGSRGMRMEKICALLKETEACLAVGC